jgi:ATP-dependent Lhr-like helicase
LAERLALPAKLVDGALLQLESEGQALRGRFRPSPDSLSPTTGSQTVEGSAPEVEWCNRRVLARIHRLTLGRLRREIQPVTSADFMRFLCRWQHAAPAGRLHGVDGTLEVIRQLQGYEIPAAAWEAEILPRRVANYKPDLLDRLCLSGEVVWGRLSPHPAFEPLPQENGGANGSSRRTRNGADGMLAGSAAQKDESVGDQEGETENGQAETRQRRVRPTRVAPISLFLREDAPSLLAEAKVLAAEGVAPAALPSSKDRGRSSQSETRRKSTGNSARQEPNGKTRAQGIQSSLSHPAREVLAALEARGACFFADLVRVTRRLPSEVEDGLWELVAAGLVTADGFENLRALLDPKRRRGEGRGRTARPRHAAGRWAQLADILAEEGAIPAPAKNSEQHVENDSPPVQPEGMEEADESLEPALAGLAPKPPASPVEAFARQVLKRWGVVFRDILQRESLAPPWRDLLMVLRRMEARGEIRGGRFVEAFRGEQFALPEAVDALRAIRRVEPTGEEVAVSPADPLNLLGIILPGPRLAASTAGTVRLRDGKLVEQPPATMLPLPQASQPTHSNATSVA